ncbi:DDE-type integrase/transposase/recombinase, partial [Palleronia caenipelagi]
MTDHLGAELCYDALRMALDQRGPVPGLILHSDRGMQYASGDDRKIIHRAKLAQSMSRKGQCLGFKLVRASGSNDPGGSFEGAERPDGELLFFAEEGAGPSPSVRNPGTGQGRDLRVHRGLLRAAS